MCTRNTSVISDTAKRFVGIHCPVCANPHSTLDFMRFLDPHGGERVDQDIFECSAHRHTFVISDAGLRLLAADGKRCRDRKLFADLILVG